MPVETFVNDSLRQYFSQYQAVFQVHLKKDIAYVNIINRNIKKSLLFKHNFVWLLSND